MKPPLFVERLLNVGTHHLEDPALSSYLRQVNLNGILYFFIDLAISCFSFFVLDDIYLASVMALGAITFIVCSIGLNYFGFTTLSRLSTVSIGSILVVITGFYLSMESHAVVLLLLGAIYPFIYFKPSEKKSILFCLAIPLIGYELMSLNHFHLGPEFHIANQLYLTISQQIFFAVAFVGIVTNAYTAVTQLELKNEEIKDSENHLQTIFKALSHDMASPITTLLFLISKAKKDKHLDESNILRLDKAANQSFEIFSSIKKIAFLKGGKYQLDLSEFDALVCIHQMIDNLKDRATEKKVTIKIVNNTGLSDIKVFADKNVLCYQVFANVLSNAIKFSKENDEISVVLSKSSMNQLNISIKDQGVGIPPQILSNLFSWEKQTSRKGTNGESGTGLGLPLAAKFLEIMSGHIEVVSKSIEESKLEHGTTMSIFIPAKYPEITNH